MKSLVRTIPSVALLGLAALTAVALLAGCSGGSAADAEENAALQSGPAAAAGSGSTTSSQPASITVPAGTVIDVSFGQALSSETAKKGDTFVATVVEPVRVDGRVAIASGSTVSGTIVDVHSSQRIGGKSKLDLRFDTLSPLDRGAEAISASFYTEGAGQTKKDAATIGGATAGGALLGRIVGNNNGNKSDSTTIGAVIGAAVGTAIAANNEGEAVTIPAGTVLQIQLDSAVTL